MHFFYVFFVLRYAQRSNNKHLLVVFYYCLHHGIISILYFILFDKSMYLVYH